MTHNLTPRQREVLALKAKGLTARDIAQRLNVSPYTVERHLQYARIKTGRTTVELAIMVAGDVAK